MKTKRIVFVFVMLFVVAIMTACGDDEQVVSGTMTFVVGTEAEYVVELDGLEITEGVVSILKHLKEAEGLDYIAETGVFGVFLNKVGELEQGENKYIYIYTSVEKDFDVSAYAKSIEHKGVKLWSSGLGVSEMSIEDGCTIYIDLIEF